MATTLRTSLRQHREATGKSLRQVRDDLLFAIPRRFVPSEATLSRIETGAVSDHKVDTILVYGLAKVLGCRVSDLSTPAGDEFEAISDLVTQSLRCMTAREAEGQGVFNFAPALA